MTQTEYRRFLELLDSVLQPIIPHFNQEEQKKLYDGLYVIREMNVEEAENEKMYRTPMDSRK